MMPQPTFTIDRDELREQVVCAMSDCETLEQLKSFLAGFLVGHVEVVIEYDQRLKMLERQVTELKSRTRGLEPDLR